MIFPIFSYLKQLGLFGHQLRQLRLVHSDRNILRRALLYVPGDDERKIAKIQTLTVDSVILDCEDGVAQNRKKDARETILKVLNEKRPCEETDWGVRINGPDSNHLPDDINVSFSGSQTPQTLYLPKVDTIQDMEKFDCIFGASVKSREGFVPPDLFIYSESCVSVMNLPEICRCTMALSEKHSRPLFRLAGIVFGSDDLVASLGATRTKSSIEILYARQRVVLIAKAFGLQAIDMVDINLNDLDTLRDLCEEGARMGYTGKQVIHPKQVEIVQNAFKPAEAMQNWARELLKAFDEHQISGKGAFVFRNQMIDAPTMKQARNIVDMMEKIEMRKV